MTAPVPTPEEFLALDTADQRKVMMVKLLQHYAFHKEQIRRLIAATGLDPAEKGANDAIALIEDLVAYYEATAVNGG